MIDLLIILRFGLLLMVFYDDFPSHIEKKYNFILTFAFGGPLFKASRSPWGSRPQVGKPWLIMLTKWNDLREIDVKHGHFQWRIPDRISNVL